MRSTGSRSAVGLVTWLMIGEPGPIRRRGEDPLDGVVLGHRRERQARDDDARAIARGHVAGDVQDRVVLVVGREDLVARLRTASERSTAFDAAGRVRDQGEVVRVCADERPERPANLLEAAVEVSGEELDRLRLEPVAPLALDLEDLDGARAVRAVVEERDLRIESPVGGQG